MATGYGLLWSTIENRRTYPRKAKESHSHPDASGGRKIRQHTENSGGNAISAVEFLSRGISRPKTAAWKYSDPRSGFNSTTHEVAESTPPKTARPDEEPDRFAEHSEETRTKTRFVQLHPYELRLNDA